MARVVKFNAAKSVTKRTVIDSMELVYLLVQTSFFGEICDKGIIVLYSLCKIIPTAIKHLPKGHCFYKSIIARKKM